MIVHHSNLFQYCFNQSTMVPTLVQWWNEATGKCLGDHTEEQPQEYQKDSKTNRYIK